MEQLEHNPSRFLEKYKQSQTDSAVKIGLVPPVAPDRIRVCGNAALQGACGLLLDQTLLSEAARLASGARTISLAEDPYFQDCYIEGMYF